MPASLVAEPTLRADRWPLRQIAGALCEHGFWVGPSLLSPETVTALRSAACSLLDVEGYAAGVGRQHQLTIDQRIRGDRIAWLDAAAPTPLQAWLAELRRVAEGLRDELRLPLREVEGMVACYPPGAGYARHIDQHHGVESRLLTCVAYLNPDWQPGDGGELELWPQDQSEPQRIEPRGGTIALLRADLPHAVQPALQPRYSCTTWLRRD